MKSLQTEGKYAITPEMRAALQDFIGGYAVETEVAEEIKTVYEKSRYVLDTHTAVASKVYRKYADETSDETKTVIASTASPYKFARSVMKALGKGTEDMSDFELVDELSKVSGVKVPPAIEEIRSAAVLHDTVVDRSDMKATVKNYLGIQ